MTYLTDHFSSTNQLIRTAPISKDSIKNNFEIEEYSVFKATNIATHPMVNPMKYPRVAFMILIPLANRFHIEMIFHYLSYPLNLSESTTTLPHKPKA